MHNIRIYTGGAKARNRKPTTEDGKERGAIHWEMTFQEVVELIITV